MSRVGNMPITMPQGVSVEPSSVDADSPDRGVIIRGPLGTLRHTVPPGMILSKEDGVLTVRRANESRQHKALHGLTRSLIANMVQGVSQGFEKRLDIVGVGYRAQPSPKGITLQVGYSHSVHVDAPEGIRLTLEGTNRVVVGGVDKVLVGEIAARIRRIRPPEPYKGKGIRYVNEQVRRKAGKTGAKKK